MSMGSMLELPKYLVEVGEPFVSPEGMILLWQANFFEFSYIMLLGYQLSKGKLN